MTQKITYLPNCQVTNGVCLDSDSTEMCYEHGECAGKGGKCCNGYCCSEDYFDAMKQLPCTNNEGCQVQNMFKLHESQTLTQPLTVFGHLGTLYLH